VGGTRPCGRDGRATRTSSAGTWLVTFARHENKLQTQQPDPVVGGTRGRRPNATAEHGGYDINPAAISRTHGFAALMLATAGVVMLANPALPIADDLLALVLGIEYSPRPGSSGATLHQMRYPRRDLRAPGPRTTTAPHGGPGFVLFGLAPAPEGPPDWARAGRWRGPRARAASPAVPGRAGRVGPACPRLVHPHTSDGEFGACSPRRSDKNPRFLALQELLRLIGSYRIDLGPPAVCQASRPPDPCWSPGLSPAASSSSRNRSSQPENGWRSSFPSRTSTPSTRPCSAGMSSRTKRTGDLWPTAGMPGCCDAERSFAPGEDPSLWRGGPRVPQVPT
jgi:hypothetical protein